MDVVVLAVGDLISHQDVQKAAIDAENGWMSLWEEVAPLFMGADLAMVNLETPIAPNTGRPGIPFCFNAPPELARALKATGVGLALTANNHAFDQGVAGAIETLGHLADAGILCVGSGLDRAAALSPAIVRLRGGIEVAVLARTDVFNNCLNQRHDRPWVAELDMDRDAETIKEIRQRVDAVIVGVHWGNEYHELPSVRQREMAARLIEAGADAVVGHHPHVLQPLEWVESGGRRGAVAFSLGNFISNQDRMYDPAVQPLGAGDSRDGGMMVMTLRRDSDGVKLLDARVSPLWTDNNWTAHGSGAERKRVIRVLTTTPGNRGQGMEALLATRRARALERLNLAAR
jgi:poly-gamma-glutamate synthesis protein (capsule biosynthesis protein)